MADLFKGLVEACHMDAVAEGMVDGEAQGEKVFAFLPIGSAEGDLRVRQGRACNGKLEPREACPGDGGDEEQPFRVMLLNRGILLDLSDLLLCIGQEIG